MPDDTSSFSRPNSAERLPCVFKACAGTMVYTPVLEIPGARTSTTTSDGTVHAVGTTRAGWRCDRNPTHIKTDGISRSEVVHSRM